MQLRWGKIGTVVGVLMMLAVSMTGCFLYPIEEEPAAPPLVKPPEIRYTTETVERVARLEVVSTTKGLVLPVIRHALRAPASGIIKTLPQVDTLYKKGDVILELENESSNLAVEAAKANLRRVELSYQAVQQRAKPDPIRVAEADLALRKLETDLAGLQAQLAAAQTPEEQQSLQFSIEGKKLEIEQAKRDLEDAKDPSKKMSAELEMAQMSLKEARDQLKRQQDAYNSSIVRSPIDGYLLYVESGKRVGDDIGGGTVLGTLGDLSRIMIKIDGNDANIPLQKGKEVQVEIASLKYGTETYTAHVSMTPDDAIQEMGFERAYWLEFEADQKKKEEIVSSTVKITQVLDYVENALVVSSARVKTDGGSPYVYVLRDGARIQQTVKVGLDNKAYAEILEGLEEGDQVIVY